MDPRRNIKAEIDGRWEAPNGAGPLLVEVVRTHSVRDIRGALLALAYALRDEDMRGTNDARGHAACVVVDSRLSLPRLMHELRQLQDLLDPQFAHRIHILIHERLPGEQAHGFQGTLAPLPTELRDWLGLLVEKERAPGWSQTTSPRLVLVGILAEQLLRNALPTTLKDLQDASQASYPTVSAVIKDFKSRGLLERAGERGVRLRPLNASEWIGMAQEFARLRKPHLFTDPTGHDQPANLAVRLQRLRSAGKLPQDTRIGGVLGAAHYFPALDISAAPRLDVSATMDPAELAHLLDAGLTTKDLPEQRVDLAVRVFPALLLPMKTHDGEGPAGSDRPVFASEFECLADIVEMGYVSEAAEMAAIMENKTRRPT